MKIIPFTPKYLEEMAQLFADEYSEPGYEWDLVTTKKYLKRNTDNFPEYCFVVIDDKGNCLGGIFCRLDPYYKGHLLFIDSIQIKKDYRKQSIGKALLKKVVETARQNGVEGVHLLADARDSFPKSWYTRIGFELTGWTEYEVCIKDLKL